MSRVNILIAGASGARFYAALEAAIALAALGRNVRIFLQGEAAALLREPITHSGDAARRAAGQPDLAWMLDEARAMDIDLSVCQTGMALVGLSAADLGAYIAPSGLVAWLAEAGTQDPMLVF